jgi:16S rRNA C967 or C1407 C5-methylase (RsmB/RsmF family)
LILVDNRVAIAVRREENVKVERIEDVVRAFLAANSSFAPELPASDRAFGFTADAATGGLTILPARHNTDGFFVATLRRQ